LIVRFAASRPYANPDLAARRLVEIANDVEVVQDGRIFIERVNAPFLVSNSSSAKSEHRALLVIQA
jgi:hypothetical protein